MECVAQLKKNHILFWPSPLPGKPFFGLPPCAEPILLSWLRAQNHFLLANGVRNHLSFGVQIIKPNRGPFTPHRGQHVFPRPLPPRLGVSKPPLLGPWSASQPRGDQLGPRCGRKYDFKRPHLKSAAGKRMGGDRYRPYGRCSFLKRNSGVRIRERRTHSVCPRISPAHVMPVGPLLVSRRIRLDAKEKRGGAQCGRPELLKPFLPFPGRCPKSSDSSFSPSILRGPCSTVLGAAGPEF